jgi:hypothetical protein
MKRKIWPIAVLILVAIVLVVSLANAYWNTLPYATYKIGDEIEGFPVDGLSITITNFSISPDSIFPASSNDVALNVTIKNLASYSVDFNQSDLQTKLIQAESKHLYLKYDLRNGFGETSPWNYTDWWGITVFELQQDGFNGLSANESVNGSIRFVIGSDNYTSFQLICRLAFQEKPLFIVNLAS